MANNKQEINLHTKRYVQVVFERRLREEGFVCPNDKLLCWYRIKNDKIVHSIIFFSPWSNMPVMLYTGYGIHPLFQKPVYTNSVNFPQRPTYHEYFCQQGIVENHPINAMKYAEFSDDIRIYTPGYDGKGIYTFEGIILPQMDAVSTIEDCYLRHKQARLQSQDADPFVNLSDIFVDEAIYLGDTEVYVYCERSIEKHIATLRECCSKRPDKKEYLSALNDWELRYAALMDGGREEYLLILENREKENLAYMNKKHMYG